jgi:ATP-dependent DNA helicase RecG
MNVDSPVEEVKGVGKAQAAKFGVLGIKTVADLIDYYPRRYDDFSTVTPINKLRPGRATIKAVIKSAEGSYRRGGMHLTEALASDKTGNVQIIWFNQSYRKSSLKYGSEYFISGEYKLSHQHFSIINPAIELTSEFPINTARIVPVYSVTKGLTSRQIRTAIRQIAPYIKGLPETLPAWLIKDEKLLRRQEAIFAIHFPASNEQLLDAQRRISTEEIFQLSLASLINKQENQKQHALKIPYREDLAVRFSKSLPFQPLTDAQRLVIMRIYKDLERAWPMNRLVEGDVGSGKTVVAAMAAVMPLEQGYQVVLMAPTELLARQHEATIRHLLKPLGWEKSVQLLVGSLTAARKTKARKAIASGQAKFIIGTHALIQEQVDMHKLALVIVDEQHRFGAEQRQKLIAKAGHMPHILSLTATPIPRSLALTLYGDIDISVLNIKPPGRQPVETEIISPNSRAQLYRTIDAQLNEGRQMFVVCPLISESDEGKFSSVEAVHKQMRDKDFKKWRVELLHGKQKPVEKNEIMSKFVSHEIDILVSTTVIEVGVDVPNATIMLIENPERFGLAQIHQLRGRVGRGYHQGFCYLMISDSSAPGPRLRALKSSNDGFKLAELDLELRGPGALNLGTQQHGHSTAELKLAKLNDRQLVSIGQRAAKEFIEKKEGLNHYPELKQRVNYFREITNIN